MGTTGNNKIDSWLTVFQLLYYGSKGGHFSVATQLGAQTKTNAQFLAVPITVYSLGHNPPSWHMQKLRVCSSLPPSPFILSLSLTLEEKK